MCLLVCAWGVRPEAPLVVLANRDEFYARPAAPLALWPEGILAGRDLQAQGTWLGLAPGGRFAALTNVREPSRPAPPGAPSRGELVPSFLSSSRAAGEWAQALEGNQYAGFNLLLCDGHELWWTSNRGPGPRRLEPGYHGLSNALLDTPWPKVRALRSALAARGPAGEPAALLDLLQDATAPADAELPQTGVGLELERLLGTVFIRGERYGTRCSSAVWSGPSGATIVEQTFGPQGARGPLVSGRVPPAVDGAPAVQEHP